MNFNVLSRYSFACGAAQMFMFFHFSGNFLQVRNGQVNQVNTFPPAALKHTSR